MPHTLEAIHLESLPEFKALDLKRREFVSYIVDKRLKRSKAAQLTGLNASREMRNPAVAAVLAEFFVEKPRKTKQPDHPDLPNATYTIRDSIRATGKTLFDQIAALEGANHIPAGLETKFDVWSDQEWEQYEREDAAQREVWRVIGEKNVTYAARVQHRSQKIHKNGIHPDGCELCSEEPL